MFVIAIAPIIWAKGAIAIVAFVATIPAVKILTAPLKKLLGGQAPENPEELVGAIGHTDSAEVRDDYGRAIVRADEKEYVVDVRTRQETISPRWVPVKLLEYDAALEAYWVEKHEDI